MSGDDFPGLAHAVEQAQRAATLLETAQHNITHAAPDEDAGARAQRLRGAAILATTAALEIMAASGWNAAAHEAEQHGLLDGEIDR